MFILWQRQLWEGHSLRAQPPDIGMCCLTPVHMHARAASPMRWANLVAGALRSDVGTCCLTLICPCVRAASHVWLLEPSVDPAVEQQAIARVHRIGQTRPVVAHRLLMDGSVEVRLRLQNESPGACRSGLSTAAWRRGCYA